MRKSLYLSMFLVCLIGYGMMPGHASSHREAPLISNDPQADNTDLYAFVSPDASDTVTLIASYIPFEDPQGGPNFYRFGDNVLYEFHIDNVGDGVDHIKYQLRFTTQTSNGGTFLYNTGPIKALDDNGRRLTDDVLDITVRAAAGALIGGKFAFSDGVDRNDVPFRSGFPYVAIPHSGGNPWKLNPNPPRGQ